MANSIWTQDPILRCQYSPHYLCSLSIQGRGGEEGREGEADVEQNVNFENAKQMPFGEGGMGGVRQTVAPKKNT